MTESDIQALNQCPVGESVTLSDGRKVRVERAASDSQSVCERCWLYREKCEQIACSKRVFVEVPNDQ